MYRGLLMLFRIWWSGIFGKNTDLLQIKQAVTAYGYMFAPPYIVYKDKRVARIESREGAVWVVTHGRKKGYSRRYKVKDTSILLYKLRQSYLNFLEAAEKPGTPKVKIDITPTRRELPG